MGFLFQPDLAYKDVQSIDMKALSEQGVRLVFCDLDNTLTGWNDPKIPAQARAFAARARANQMDLVIVSNNGADRVRLFAQALNVSYLPKAKKPLPFALRRYMRRHHAVPQKAVMVGDQLVTDMLAGNLAGVRTILVRPLDLSNEYAGTRVNRALERLIFRFVQVNWL